MRTRHTHALAAVAWLAAMAGPAAAQLRPPSVSCEAADFTMTLRLFIPLAADGSGAPAPDGMLGALEIHHSKVERSQRVWVLDGRRPAQFWNEGGELKIMLRLGSFSEPITVIIETAQRQGDTQHTGAFTLVVAGTRLKGRLACNVR